MLIFFADDARQAKPSRPGMGPVVGAGAIGVPESEIRVLELQLSRICSNHGFPEGEEFKWSPGRELWMSSHLIEGQRSGFYRDVLETAGRHKVVATVIVEDASGGTVTGSS